MCCAVWKGMVGITLEYELMGLGELSVERVGGLKLLEVGRGW